jgi:mannose-6-phosphate isomerase-like protein (cupin superfamily)
MTATQTESHRRRFDASHEPRRIGPADGKSVDLGSLGVRFMAWAEETGSGFSLVEHPIPPRSLCAPVHKHSREDEYSFVLEGRMGALLGDETVFAEAGDLVFKPRDQWHTFWNAGDEPCRILEIISPGGFEHYFDEVAEVTSRPDFTPDMIGPIAEKYGLEFDFESMGALCEEHGLELRIGT